MNNYFSGIDYENLSEEDIVTLTLLIKNRKQRIKGIEPELYIFLDKISKENRVRLFSLLPENTLSDIVKNPLFAKYTIEIMKAIL